MVTEDGKEENDDEEEGKQRKKKELLQIDPPSIHVAKLFPYGESQIQQYKEDFGDAEQCHEGCLRNCSCSAFSNINRIGCFVWNQELLAMVKVIEGGEFLWMSCSHLS